MVEAMINAAKADGSIDQGEIQRIAGKLENEGAAPEARSSSVRRCSSPWTWTR